MVSGQSDMLVSTLEAGRTKAKIKVKWTFRGCLLTF